MPERDTTACEVLSDGACLPGLIGQADNPRGWVVFAHGAGSGHTSPRNARLAAALNAAGFSTLLFDLLTPQEDDPQREARFDIPLLSNRVRGAVDWLREARGVRLPIGLFGASTGAAAALRAAARGGVSCVVSRGGRVDLAGRDTLQHITCPVLLIVGELDDMVLAQNQRALHDLAGPTQLVAIPGATHLFEEPGALDEVAEHAVAWFENWLQPPAKKLRPRLA